VGADPAERPVFIIEPPKKWAALELRTLWPYRELFWTLAARDLKVRYKQTALGAAWAIIQPVVMMVLFTVIFGRLAGFAKETNGVPYPVFTYVALLPWTYFAGTITNAGNSLVASASLITKVYFPRLLIPLSTAVTGLVDLGIAFVVLIAMMVYYGTAPTWGVLALPLFVLLATGAALGVGLWLSALNVEYRDVKHVIPFLVQVWMYLSPVAYPVGTIPAQWQTLYSMNPMVGVVEGFRWALLGKTSFPLASLVIGTGVVGVVLISGLFYFRRTERIFADVV
jgi:lipopolysaccharide transport system permease protein